MSITRKDREALKKLKSSPQHGESGEETTSADEKSDTLRGKKSAKSKNKVGQIYRCDVDHGQNYRTTSGGPEKSGKNDLMLAGQGEVLPDKRFIVGDRLSKLQETNRLRINVVLTAADAEEAVETLRFLMKSRSQKAAYDAATYILDQLYGRARQSVEMSGADGGPIEIANARDEFLRRINASFEVVSGDGLPADSGADGGAEVEEGAPEPESVESTAVESEA